MGYDLIIVGGGPAGLTAGLYGARGGLKTLLLERSMPGGAGCPDRVNRELSRLSSGRGRSGINDELYGAGHPVWLGV
jgi:flavin-dependent dehydrogenase